MEISNNAKTIQERVVPSNRFEAIGIYSDLSSSLGNAGKMLHDPHYTDASNLAKDFACMLSRPRLGAIDYLIRKNGHNTTITLLTALQLTAYARVKFLLEGLEYGVQLSLPFDQESEVRNNRYTKGLL